MRKILLIILTLSIALLNISCSQNDGFKDEAERSFMKAHGIKTKGDLDRLMKAKPNERVNIAANSFASQVDLKYVEQCSAYVAVTFNAALKENIGSIEENEKLKNAYLFMWDKVFNVMVKDGEKKEQSNRAMQANFIYSTNVFNGNDEVAKNKILDTNAECTKKIVPYFSFEEIESYVEKNTSSITQTNPAPAVKVDTSSIAETTSQQTNSGITKQEGDQVASCHFMSDVSGKNGKAPDTVLTNRQKTKQVFWGPTLIENYSEKANGNGIIFTGTLSSNASITGTVVPNTSINVYIENKTSNAKLTYFCPHPSSNVTNTGSSTKQELSNSDKFIVKQCDEVAGSSLDPQKAAVGVSYDKLDSTIAVPICKQATDAEPKNARAWFQLGRAYEKQNNVSEAIVAYQKGAELGSASAYNNIGELYRQGKGFPKNKEKAAEFFKKSADLGSTEGRDNLSALSKSK